MISQKGKTLSICRAAEKYDNALLLLFRQALLPPSLSK